VGFPLRASWAFLRRSNRICRDCFDQKKSEEIAMRLHPVAALLLAASAFAAAQAPTAPWSYFGKTGPLNWGKLDPAYRACSEGREQSPVDIRGAHLNKSLPPIEFHYLGESVTLENTGNTVRIPVKSGSYIVYDGVRYDLKQFHFHHPSEEAVHGKLTDLVVHLVHESADGKTAVVAVRFTMDRGDPNPLLAALWPYLPKRAGEQEKIDDMINPGGFLPADRGYWTYLGSLTIPPCTEGVRWLVFEDVLSMSRAQLQAFTNIFPMNSRPLQDLHGRRIEANE
jgi:carbonic anhydrase